jgi:hypothetical protein
MSSVLVYRPDVLTIDRNGDVVDANGDVVRQTSPGTYIGTLTGVVIADPSVASLSRGMNTNTADGNATARGAFASVDALLGCPVGANIKLQQGDYVVTEQGVTYSIFGPRTYGRPNAVTGQPIRINGTSYYWVRATTVT